MRNLAPVQVKKFWDWYTDGDEDLALSYIDGAFSCTIRSVQSEYGLDPIGIVLRWDSMLSDGSPWEEVADLKLNQEHLLSRYVGSVLELNGFSPIEE